MDAKSLVQDLHVRAVRSHLSLVALFDCDGTIIFNDCFEALLQYMAWHRIGNAQKIFHTYREMLQHGETEAAYRFGPSVLEDFSPEYIKELVRKALIREGATLGSSILFGWPTEDGIALREDVGALIPELRADGIKAVVVSASPKVVVEATLDYFHVEVDQVIGIENKIDCGSFTAEIVEPAPIYQGKVECVQGFLGGSIKPVMAMGDSMNDLNMLQFVEAWGGLPILVKRQNPVAELAAKKDWVII